MKPSVPIRVSRDFFEIIERERNRMKQSGLDISIPAVTKAMARQWKDKNGRKTLIEVLEEDMRKRKIRL